MVTRTGRLAAALVFGLLTAGGALNAREKPAPQWDGKEPIADYAKRVGVEPRLVLDLGAGVKLELVLIPAGKFMMGSPVTEKGREPDEGPQHAVTISHPFYMSRYEVTQEQYEGVAGANPSPFQSPKNPVEMVELADAESFCTKVSRKTSRTVRLPTEAEWEYACRAGTTTRFYSGNADVDLGGVGWYEGNSDKRPHPVGEKKPNAWGLHDMLGNAWEWCSDWYLEYPIGAATDPKGPTNGDSFVQRGGSSRMPPVYSRAAVRSKINPYSRLDNGGFRVVVMAVQNQEPFEWSPSTRAIAPMGGRVGLKATPGLVGREGVKGQPDAT